jgi:putative tricarboxylic transport membrane protein
MEERVDWRGAALILCGIVAFMALLVPAGMVLGGAALSAFVATAFRSPKPVRDTVIGMCVSLAAYLLFTRVLGLQIPAGAIIDALLG